MINTRKTMAAGVAASLGVMIWVLQPAFGASVAMTEGVMHTDDGAPVTHCELEDSDATKCTPKSGEYGGGTTFNKPKCFDFVVAVPDAHAGGFWQSCNYTPATTDGGTNDCRPVKAGCSG